MEIQNNIIKYYLRNVYFITGTAYAGKSTMVRLLAEKYSMIFCGENYHSTVGDKIKVPENQPASCFFETMSGWQEFLNRSPEEYYHWICESSKEAAQMEIAQLISLVASGENIVVDTNIPIEILQEISDYYHVAVMLSPQAMSVERFFDRDDPEKIFLREQISLTSDPEKTMSNFRACIAKINSQEEYDRYSNSGFFTLIREDADVDTKAEVLDQLACHFKLKAPRLC